MACPSTIAVYRVLTAQARLMACDVAMVSFGLQRCFSGKDSGESLTETQLVDAYYVAKSELDWAVSQYRLTTGNLELPTAKTHPEIARLV
jgi:hypothetical protein